MERKHKSYIKEWRIFRGYTQKQLLGRLSELVGEMPSDDPSLNVPTTEASLSRIENGKQNFSMATLEALARALEVAEPGWLLSRNPTKAGEVVSFLDALSDAERERAAAVLRAMFVAERDRA